MSLTFTVADWRVRLSWSRMQCQLRVLYKLRIAVAYPLNTLDPVPLPSTASRILLPTRTHNACLCYRSSSPWPVQGWHGYFLLLLLVHGC